jgi:hypothetical protein
VHAGIYLVVAAIQFRGAEAIFWFVYGLQHGSARPAPSPAEEADAA